MALDEQLMVGLRRREGVDVMILARQWGWDNKHCQIYLNSLNLFWKDCLERGLLKREGWRFQLNDPLGMEISNQVIVQMFLWWDSLPDSAVELPNP